MARQLPPTSEPRARDHGPDLQVHLERVTRIELALSAWEAQRLWLLGALTWCGWRPRVPVVAPSSPWQAR